MYARALVLIAVFAAATVTPASRPATGAAAPAPWMTIPPGYRDWTLYSVAREEGTLRDIRAILGNVRAIEASGSGRKPFPDGAIFARVAWSYVPLAESARAFGRLQSFVAGEPKNGVQFMMKDSKRFASTGGWGYAQFDDGKLSTAETQRTCFACHSIVKDRDFIFTHYVR